MADEGRQAIAAAANNGRFDIGAVAAKFPATATTLLVDEYLTNREQASARVFRVYRPAPAHYHATCDEYLYVLSGRAMFFFGDEAAFELGPGRLIFFKKGTVHGTSELLEEPFIVLSVDTPRRDPTDVIFVNPDDGTPEQFIQSQQL